MTETYISKFTVLGLTFIRRPICDPPKEDALVFLDNGEGGGWTYRAVGIFKDGAWLTPKGQALRFIPQFWSVIEDREKPDGE